MFNEHVVDLDDFRAVYDVFKCVCFRPRVNIQLTETTNTDVGRKRKRYEASSSPSLSHCSHKSILDAIRETYESASPRDQETWNIENDGNGNHNHLCIESPSKFLSVTSNPGRSNKDDNKNGESIQEDTANICGYCSFILQDDSNNAVTAFTKRMENIITATSESTIHSSVGTMLPHSLLLTDTNPALGDCPPENVTENRGEQNTITMANHYWIFVGRNQQHCGGGEWMSGRKEHTDSIEHDGTFHHQLLGSKLWKLRPTAELRERCDRDHDLALLDRYELLVEEGDVFVINTQLWWHQTEIPPGWSVSYARDLYLERRDVTIDGGPTMESAQSHWEDENVKRDSESDTSDLQARESVGNVEVSWASAFIPRGTTLVVHDVIDDDNEYGDDCSNGDDDDGKVASFYEHLVPPTILRTCHESRANCKLVLLSIEKGSDEPALELEQGGKANRGNGSTFHSNSRQTSKPKQLVLEAIRDIPEGEEFVMLLKKRKV